MFTGIIRTTGILMRSKTGILAIMPKATFVIHAGDSIAVNGVCLTVEKKQGKTLYFSCMPVTLSTTNLGRLRTSDIVNLELPLRYGDRVDGHFVLGHVDGVGVIAHIVKKQSSKEIIVCVPSVLKKYCVAKGSITFDGVSLTIISIRGRDVRVSLTPYTLHNTRFAKLRVGDTVNIEVDILARYQRLPSPRRRGRG